MLFDAIGLSSDRFCLSPFKLFWQIDFPSFLSMETYVVSLRSNFVILVCLGAIYTKVNDELPKFKV